MTAFRQKHAPYLGDAINDQADIVKYALKGLHGVEFDALVGTGLSGSMVVPLLAYVLGKRFAIVRKENDAKGNHSCGTVESGMRQDDRWIFVDDFISSGTSRYRVANMIAEHHPEADLIGDYLYNSNDGRRFDTSFADRRKTQVDDEKLREYLKGAHENPKCYSPADWLKSGGRYASLLNTGDRETGLLVMHGGKSA